jgi:histidinol-phosphate aminotransferase
MSISAVPAPRSGLLNPDLTRPDWTAGVARDPGRLWLDKNENTDPEMIQLVERLLRDIDVRAVHTYPESAALYHKLARHAGVEPDHVLLTAGSDGGIRAVFEAFVSPGDAVVHTSPTFAMYPVYCRMFSAREVPVVYEPTPRGPRLEAAALLDLIDATAPKLVCLPNPDSPTGTVLPPADLRRIIAASGRHGAVVLIDEAYHPFHAETSLPYVAENPHLVIVRTCAKAWALAGLRIGYAIANPQLARLLHKVRPNYEINAVAIALMQRLLDREADMYACVRRLNAGRDHFVAAMDALGFRTLHAKGNFLHVAFGDRAEAIHAALDDLVYYRRDFADPCLRGFSRFSATTVERFEPIVRRIQQTVAQEDRGSHRA